VQALFATVQDTPSGNPFSNANRAVDHLLAYGRTWRQQPLPLLLSGSLLPEALIATVESLLEATHLLPDQGYLVG
jgi:4-hydroxy-tetrahydrodipicolinate synthase